MTWFLTFSPVLHLQRRTKYPLIGNQLLLQAVYVTSNASTNIENVNVAINTPLPKAIIVVINLSDNLK